MCTDLPPRLQCPLPGRSPKPRPPTKGPVQQRWKEDQPSASRCKDYTGIEDLGKWNGLVLVYWPNRDQLSLSLQTHVKILHTCSACLAFFAIRTSLIDSATLPHASQLPTAFSQISSKLLSPQTPRPQSSFISGKKMRSALPGFFPVPIRAAAYSPFLPL